MKKFVYPNGLTLIVDEAQGLSSVCLGAWIKTGSRHEGPDQLGLSHFLEHMLFKGSERKNATAIAREVEQVGGDFNAFTTREQTCFHFYLPHSQLNLGAKLLKEMIFRPSFLEKEIEREREVILQEIAMTKESPEEESFDDFFEYFYPEHSLGRRIIGTEDSVKSFKRRDLFHFFMQHYRPSQMVIAVSGNVKFEAVKRAFREMGKGMWPHRESDARLKAQWGANPPSRMGKGGIWREFDSEQAHVLYGWNAPIQTSEERIIAQLIQQHLGGGMSSVLFDQIRERRGWAYSVYATHMQFLDASCFVLYAGVKTERVLETLKIMKREVQKIEQEGIPAADLKRIRESMLYAFHLGQESTESRMMAIAMSELFFKKGMTFREFQEKLKALRAKDIAALLQKWRQESTVMTYVLGERPKGKADRELVSEWVKQETKSDFLWIRDPGK